MKYIALIIISFFNMAIVFAQEDQISFSLKEAQEYALQHNKTLMNANRDIDLAKEQIKEARGNGLPQFSASVEYMTNFNYEFAFSMGGGSDEPINIDYTVLDAGDYEVLGSLDQMLGSSEGSNIVMEDQANAKLQITQLIFSGQYWLGMQMAKTGKMLVEKNLSLTKLDVRESVTNTYYLSLITNKLLNVIKENQKNLENILKHTEDMYKAGMAEQTDADQLRISLSQLENSKKSMERNVRLNMNMFRFVLGVENNNEIILTDSLDYFVDIIETNDLLNTEFDITNNPSYQIMLAQEEIGEKTINMQKWAYAPTLAAYYSYTEKMLETSFDLSPKNVAGLTLNIPIYSGGTKRAQVNKAKIELDKISTNRSLLEEQLQLQNNQLTFELSNAYDNYMTQKENVNVAKRVYDNIHNKYKQGMVSSLDLTQANTNYLQAENNYVSAILDLLQAKLKKDKLYNQL